MAGASASSPPTGATAGGASVGVPLGGSGKRARGGGRSAGFRVSVGRRSARPLRGGAAREARRVAARAARSGRAALRAESASGWVRRISATSSVIAWLGRLAHGDERHADDLDGRGRSARDRGRALPRARRRAASTARRSVRRRSRGRGSRRAAARRASIASCWGSCPARIAWSSRTIAAALSCSPIASITARRASRSRRRPRPAAAIWSRTESASRADPGPVGRPRRAPRAGASSAASRATSASSPVSVSSLSRWNSKCWVRLRIVGSTLCGSVVASTKMTCAGAPRASSTARSKPRPRACAPRRRCTPSSDRAMTRRRARDEVAHRVDAVVRGRVELVDVKGAARR